MQRRNLTLAVVASGIIGIAADSVLFLSLTFGSLDVLTGKGWDLLLALPVAHGLRERDRRRGFGAAS